jgi:hypothetical protein
MDRKKLLEIFQNRGKIWEGLRNKYFKKEHVEAVYEERMEICRSCNNYDVTGSGCALPGTQPCCNENTGGCGCSLSIKLRSLSTDCPLGKWKALMSQKEEELLKAGLNDKTQ